MGRILVEGQLIATEGENVERVKIASSGEEEHFVSVANHTPNDFAHVNIEHWSFLFAELKQVLPGQETEIKGFHVIHEKE